MSLKGKTAVVTGGGSGIGRAIALRLAHEGANVAVWGRTAASLDETTAMISSRGGVAVACVGDATVQADIEHLLARTRAAFGRVSILVNNAGIAPFSPFLQITEAAMVEVLRANVVGPFLCTQAVLRDMLDAKWGRIVNITSSIAQDGLGTMVHYAASKSGLVGMTKALAMEFADQGITVSTTSRSSSSRRPCCARRPWIWRRSLPPHR